MSEEDISQGTVGYSGTEDRNTILKWTTVLIGEKKLKFLKVLRLSAIVFINNRSLHSPLKLIYIYFVGHLLSVEISISNCGSLRPITHVSNSPPNGVTVT